MADRLRSAGFKEDTTEDAPVCRWVVDGIAVDLMPPIERVLGFTNRWYRDAFTHSMQRKVDGVEIRVVTAPYFVATKIVAFHDRGKLEFRSSRDIEDIITVVDGRAELAEEVASSLPDLRRFIATEIKGLLQTPRFVEAVAGHLSPDAANQARVGIVLARLEVLAAND